MKIKIVFTAVGAAVGCAMNPVLMQTPARPESLVGCYSLAVGKWNPGMIPGDDTLPSMFWLLAEKGEGPFGGEARAVRPVIPARWATAFWVERGDSVRVTWTNGFAGFHLHLRTSADSLYGTAERFTDVMGGTNPRASAIARRISCD
jgi:hypothetical protein